MQPWKTDTRNGGGYCKERNSKKRETRQRRKKQAKGQGQQRF